MSTARAGRRRIVETHVVDDQDAGVDGEVQDAALSDSVVWPDAAREWVEGAREWVDGALDRVAGFVEQRPLVAVGAATTVGFLLARLVRR